MLVDCPRCLSQSDSVDYGAVIQLIGDNYILGATHKRGDEADIGCITSRVD